MSDNLAHKLNNFGLGSPTRPAPERNDFYDSTSPELALNRMKYQARQPQNETAKPDKPARDNKGGSTANQLSQAKNIATKALSGEGDTEEVAELGAKTGTAWLLTTLWGSVWLDYTLLSLLGLNAMLVVSLVLPNYVCQFGDDYLIGKWIPSRDLAKWTEIIILMVINVMVFSIIIISVVFIYKLVACGTWDLFNIALSGVLPGGDTVLSEAQKRCFQ
ncbi:MAG: hypothetical protein Q7K65_00200 [Candidatus Buchananbacteria bacterium]|nr:hypothetical protein [Candidatus Buchananbacteria bacterium]